MMMGEVGQEREDDVRDSSFRRAEQWSRSAGAAGQLVLEDLMCLGLWVAHTGDQSSRYPMRPTRLVLCASPEVKIPRWSFTILGFSG